MSNLAHADAMLVQQAVLDDVAYQELSVVRHRESRAIEHYLGGSTWRHQIYPLEGVGIGITMMGWALTLCLSPLLFIADFFLVPLAILFFISFVVGFIIDCAFETTAELCLSLERNMPKLHHRKDGADTVIEVLLDDKPLVSQTFSNEQLTAAVEYQAELTDTIDVVTAQKQQMMVEYFQTHWPEKAYEVEQQRLQAKRERQQAKLERKQQRQIERANSRQVITESLTEGEHYEEENELYDLLVEQAATR